MKIKIVKILFIFLISIPLYIGFAVDFKNNFNKYKNIIISNNISKLNLNELKKIGGNVKKILNENLIAKDTILKFTNNIISNSSLFFSSEMYNALIGENGFIFLGNKYNNVITRHYGNNYKETGGQYVNLLKLHSEFQEAAKKVNSEYIVLVAPDKHGIYCREIPEWVNSGQCAKADRITQKRKNFLEKNGINVVFPFNDLREKSFTESVYYKTDTHWNEKGAEIAFFALVDEMEKRGQVFSKKKFQKNSTYSLFIDEKTWSGDLVRMAGIQAPLSPFFRDSAIKVKMADNCKVQWKKNRDTDFAEVDIEALRSVAHAPYEQMINPNASNNLKVFMIHDSFNTAMSIFWNIHFSEVIYAYRGNSTDELQEIIKSFKPDLIVYELVERDF